MIIGGNDGCQALKSCERYNYAANKWEYIKGLNFGRSAAKTIEIDNLIYVYGGTDNNGNILSSIE